MHFFLFFSFFGGEGVTHRFFFSRRCLKLRLLPKVTNSYRKASNSLYTRRGETFGAASLSSLFCFCLLAAIYGGKQVARHVVYKYVISKQSPTGEIFLSLSLSLRNVFLIKMLIACRLEDLSKGSQRITYTHISVRRKGLSNP